MIVIDNISKQFGEHKVLNNISVTFEPGKTNLIIGQSGSGKTVFMRSMLGLIMPDSGTITFDGRNMLAMNLGKQAEVRKEMGVVFQGGALFDSMTVEENVMFPLRMFQKESQAKMKERVDFCLERVDLKKSNKLYPNELSGGMKKRVAIARAIATNPKYLFCDEPNSGLDPRTSMVIDKLIKAITEEYSITTVVNTHDMNSVLEIGDTISFLYEGKLWWQGDRNTVLNSENEELDSFMFCSALTKRLRGKEPRNNHTK